MFIVCTTDKEVNMTEWQKYSKFFVYMRRFIRYNLMASGKSAPCQ